MVAEHLAVVGAEHDQGVVGESELVEGGEDGADLVVDHGQGGGVLAPGGDDLFFGVAVLLLADPSRAAVGRVEHRWRYRRVAEPVGVLGWWVEGVVGSDEADVEVPGVVVGDLAEPLTGPPTDVGVLERVSWQYGVVEEPGEGERRVLGLAEVTFDDVDHPLVAVGGEGFEQALFVEPPAVGAAGSAVLSSAGVHLAFDLHAVGEAPLVSVGSVALGSVLLVRFVQVELAHHTHPVPRVAEPLVVGGDPVGQRIAVAEGAEVHWRDAGGEPDPGWGTQRAVGDVMGEAHAAGGHGVEVWRLDPWCAMAAEPVPAMLVGGDEEEVRSVSHGPLPPCRCGRSDPRVVRLRAVGPR